MEDAFWYAVANKKKRRTLQVTIENPMCSFNIIASRFETNRFIDYIFVCSSSFHLKYCENFSSTPKRWITAKQFFF